MKCPRLPTLFLTLAAAAAISSAIANGQAAQSVANPTAGKLALSTSSTEAQSEFWKGLEDWQSFSYSSGERHFRRAYALDNGFALPRVFATREIIAPATAMERDKALAEAARQSPEEGLLALFWREKALGHFNKARILLRAAMQLVPNEPGPATEFLWSSVGDNVDSKLLVDSARALRARFPSYGPLALVQSVISMNAGDTAGALRAAEDFTRIAPQSGAAFGYYGSLLRQLGRYDEAEVQLRKGMQLLPAHADYGNDAASSLAEMYALRGRYADARAVATEALAKVTDPSDSAMYMAEIAGTYLATGDDRRALQLLQQARQKSETLGGGTRPVPFDYFLAEASAFTGDLSSLRSYLGRVQPQTANDSAMHMLQYAADYAYAGQLDSSLAYSDRLAKLAAVPWAAGYAHHTRGIALAAAKQCARARAELSQAPDTAGFEMQYTRADCEFQLGNKAAAVALRDRAIASQDFVLLDPAYVNQRKRLAQMK